MHKKFSLQAFERLLNSFDDNQDIASNNTSKNNLETNNSQMIQNDNTPVSTMIIQTGGALDTDTNHQTNQQERCQNDVIIVQESSHFNKKFQVSQDTYSLKFISMMIILLILILNLMNYLIKYTTSSNPKLKMIRIKSE